MTEQPAERRGPSGTTGVWIRLVVSPVLLAVLLGVLWVHDATGDATLSNAVLLLLGATGALEMARLIRDAGRAVSIGAAAVFSGLLAGVGLFGPQGLDLALPVDLRLALLSLAVVAASLVPLRDTRPRAAERIAFTLAPVLYVGLLLSWTSDLMAFDRPARVLVWVVLTAKASDMGGWLIGKPFGRHKLIPSVSPGKSWEGLAGGLAASVLAAVLLPPWLGLDAAAWGAPTLVAFGLLVGLASVLAGITWSGWKRRLGAKDSSTLLPEVGGVVDLVDSLLLAGPVALAFILAQTPAP